MYNEFVIDDIHDGGRRVTILSAVIMFKGSSTNCLIVDHENANLFKQTYNNIPWVEVPVATLEDNKMKIYVDPVM
jgi:hypothetical protein|nr:MAG TPA: hypothetical protein [Bacteriophage sp.]